MRIRVQSRHLLDESLLVILWRKSADDESFQDWERNPKTNLGQFDGNFFWMNWLETNRGLVSVIDLGIAGYSAERDNWRILIELTEKEKDSVFVFYENESSVYAYFNNELICLRLILEKSGPQVEKTRPEEPPPWLASKIAAIRKEWSPEAMSGRIDNLKTRLQQLKQRRA